MMGAMGATAGATGTRAWLATRRWAWLTPVVLKRITLGLLAVVLVASTLLVGGSTAPRGATAATDSGPTHRPDGRGGSPNQSPGG